MLLVDRAGRYWGYVRDGQLAHRLECYDSKAKQWLPPRLAAGVERKDLRGDPPLSVLGQWHDPSNSQGSFEDAAGNLYFLGGAERERNSTFGFGMHRLAPDGTWTFQKFDKPYGSDDFLRPGGRITIAARYGYGSPDDCRVMHYDGGGWSEINPVVEHGQFSSVYAVVPLKDGSIATLMDGNHLWAYWPKGSVPGRTLDQLAEML